MAIAQMQKFLIVSHRSQAEPLLEALQQEAICQILDIEQTAVSKAYPDLSKAGERPRDIEELTNRLAKGISFLKMYGKAKGGLLSALAPRAVIDEQAYSRTVSDENLLRVLEQCEQAQLAIEKHKSEIDNLTGRADELRIWQGLTTPVEELGQLKQAVCWAGLIPTQRIAQLEKGLTEAGAAIQRVGSNGNRCACVVVALKETAEDVQKMLRAAEFEPANFTGMKGTVSQAMKQIQEQLADLRGQLSQEIDNATRLAENLLGLEILYDHHNNLFNRQQQKGLCPATGQTVVLEGYVKEKDFQRLESIVVQHWAAVQKIEPAKGEDIPVDIDNPPLIRPFEAITRLFGMPQRYEVDPTVFLMPFFALFFGICLGDAGYGLVTILMMAFAIWKMQGDKKIVWMLFICGFSAVAVGALTGSWFGDAIQQFIPALDPLRKKLMWFDPLEKPMLIFGISLGLGYTQIMTGLLIAFVHNLKQKKFVAAVCDQLTWLTMLNSIVLLSLSKAGAVPASIGKVCGMIIPVPAATIVLFSCREGSWGGRIGMGAFNLFSAIFYMGDVLSYLRLMGLMLVGAGLGMAMNIIGTMTLKFPYGIGIIVTILVLIVGHGFNLVLSALGAFVHTLRLQFVEFFPKFVAGGGRLFEPFSKQYTYIYMDEKSPRS